MKTEFTNVVYLQASQRARGVFPFCIVNGFELRPIEGKRNEFKEGVRVWWLNDTERVRMGKFLSKRAELADKCARMVELLKEEAQNFTA